MKLNSATGVELPGRKAAPPMKTISRISGAISGAFTSARAILVMGPTGQSVMPPGSARMRSISTSTAWPGATAEAGGGRPMSPKPSPPWTESLRSTGAMIGRPQPA
jgi:hypothetical protein